MTAQRYLVIVNPQARHGETRSLVPVIEGLLVDMPHETIQTESPGHAVDLAADGEGFDVIVAAGGDGTVHEVLNGLMRHPADARPALAVLPTGSGNDTCRTLGIPFDLARAALLLATGERRRFDIGRCNDTYFNNSFAAGLDAKVTAKAVEYKVTKHRDGLWLYLTALMQVLFHDLAPIHVAVSLDGSGPEERDTLIVAVTNGPTYGGGFRITPDSRPDDGLFDVCMIDPLTLPRALVRLPFVVAGRHRWLRAVHISRHTSLTLSSDVPVPAQIDGELLMEKRYEISLLPAAIECVVPKGA